MASSIHIDDATHMNKINPFTLPGTFTPGVSLGGAYKMEPGTPSIPLVNAVNPVNDALGGTIGPQAGEPSPACLETRAAGWGTASFCEDIPLKLDRPHFPMRRYDSPPWDQHDRKLLYAGPGREGLFGFAPTNQTTALASLALLSGLAIMAIYVSR